MKNHSDKIVVWTVGFLALGSLAFYLLGLPVDRSRLSLLSVGMTRDEVAKILGKPNAAHEMASGTLWVYESPYHLFAVEVRFDWKGRYERHWEEP